MSNFSIRDGEKKFMGIRNIIVNHIKIYDIVTKLHHCIDNRRYYDLLNQVEKMDSILEYEKFKDTIQEKIFCKNPIALYRYSRQSYYYGYYDSFIEYAGVNKAQYNIPMFSHMEHGMADCSNNKTPFSTDSVCYCSHSDYRRQEIHKIAPARMYFSIGPYIHYAKKYYSEEKEQKIKNKLGRTLLVFPFHQCEGEINGVGQENVLLNTVYSKYHHMYDTIMVCAYWYDVNSSIFDEYKKRGAKIVSAGFRGDPNFIRRLKSIISLSDAAVMDEMGTNLGFCIYMNKPVYMEKRECRMHDRVYKENMKKFIEAFYSENQLFDENQKKLQNQLYEYFWGGSCTKTRDEARAILEVIKSILQIAGYNMKSEKINNATLQHLQHLKRQNSIEGQLQYQVLKQALE